MSADDEHDYRCCSPLHPGAPKDNRIKAALHAYTPAPILYLPARRKGERGERLGLGLGVANTIEWP